VRDLLCCCIRECSTEHLSSRPKHRETVVPPAISSAQWRDPDAACTAMPLRGVLPRFWSLKPSPWRPPGTHKLGRTPRIGMAEDTLSGSLHSAPLIPQRKDPRGASVEMTDAPERLTRNSSRAGPSPRSAAPALRGRLRGIRDGVSWGVEFLREGGYGPSAGPRL